MIHTMKSEQIIMLYFVILAGLFAGCSDDNRDFAPEKGHPGGSIVLRLGGNGSVQTRTQLKGSYNLHHVKQVYAILYQGEGDGATYISHQDLSWNPQSDTEYGEGIIQKKEFKLATPASLADGTYTLLCVGLDDQSGTTYGLAMSSETVPAFCATGKKLADAKAVLAAGMSMTQSELFAGWENFAYSTVQVNEVNVELCRRVAGAYVYLKDIPVTMFGKDVKFLHFVSGNLPPSEIGLARQPRTGAAIPDDFGSGTQEKSAKTLDVLEMKSISTPGINNLYEINPEYTASMGIAPHTLLLSAYLLPMNAGSENTFSVELLDEANGVIKSFPAVWKDAPTGTDTQKYPVYPNYIYHIGTRDGESDRPESLAGDRLELVVQAWTEFTIDTEFPNVPIDASIDYDKNQSKYIYDCINTTDSVKILPSLMKKDWKMTIVPEDKEGNIDLNAKCDWLYFEMPDGSYAQGFQSKDYEGYKDTTVTVTIRMNDYVVERDIDAEYNPNLPAGREAINTDWRRARIVLATEESSSDVHLSFRQYNAITVKGRYDYLETERDYKCGFSRFDMGVKRDKDGNITEQGTTNGWGFWSSAFFQIHQPYDYSNPDCVPCYDGEVCYTSAEKNKKGFPLSIIQISRQESLEWDGNNNLKGESFWYLPSQLELYSFFDRMVRHETIESHIEANALYWSGTAYCDGLIAENHVKSYCQRTSNIDSKYGELRTKNGSRNLGYSRRARKF